MILSKKMHPTQRLPQFRSEAEQELKNILSWWTKYSVDHGNGGFFGKIDNENNIDADAVKGSVLNGRILWTFSSAYIFFKDPHTLKRLQGLTIISSVNSSILIMVAFSGRLMQKDNRRKQRNRCMQMLLYCMD